VDGFAITIVKHFHIDLSMVYLTLSDNHGEGRLLFIQKEVEGSDGI
jgi:hypothetical protein